jgi:hypothetical protein
MRRFEHHAVPVDEKKIIARTNFRKKGKFPCCRCESNDTIRAAFRFEMMRDISARLVRLFAENIRLKAGGVRKSWLDIDEPT